MSDRRKAWLIANKERIKAYKRAQYKKSPAKYIAKSRAYHLKNHDSYKAYHKRYNSQNAWRWFGYRLSMINKHPECMMHEAGILSLDSSEGRSFHETMADTGLSPFQFLVCKEEFSHLL